MSTPYELTLETFLKDVSSHQMQVIRDDGVNRHVRFKRAGTMCMHFDLVTWPGYLCYTGDMGTYVFSRLNDMFEFFRGNRINPDYWSEKVQAADRDGVEEFDADAFRRVVNQYRLDWVRQRKVDGEARRELWEAVQSEVIDRVEEGEHVAMTAAYEFSHRSGKHNYWFEDFFDHQFKKHTHRFIWCCYAMQWGIAKYDAEKIQVAA